jgi:hypothetical protein
MAQVKIEDVVDHLDSEFTRALDDTFRQFAPGVTVNSGAAFRYFLQRVYSHCSVWEQVPDHYVEK